MRFEQQQKGSKNSMYAQSSRSEQLMTALAGSSRIGFAVLDDQLRYQMVNEKLASINRLSVDAHIGAPVRDIFPDIFRQIAKPHYDRVLSSGHSTHFEVANQVLPMRAHQSYWGLNINFPIYGANLYVRQIGVFVVEITEERTLQSVLRELSSRLSGNAERSFWYATKIQDTLDRYYDALSMSFNVLYRAPTDSMEQLVLSVEALDARLDAMSQLISNIGLSFPVNVTDGPT